MTVRHRVFESATESWDDLCAEVEAFASTLGRERLINISVAASGGTHLLGLAGKGVIVVWYWEAA